MKLIHTKGLPSVSITHNREIKKKVLLGGGEIPGIKTLGQATFKPRQSVEKHVHEKGHEVFYILSGKAEFVVEGKKIELIAGDCILIEPGESHSQGNPYKRDVVWLYFRTE